MPRTPVSAWDAALRLLAGRDYSRSEMEAKLRGRGYPELETDAALDKLLSYGYVVKTGSDPDALAAMAESYLAKKGKALNTPGAFRALEAFLLRKGFDAELVREYLLRRRDEGR
jgi:SOS response regulatory protein OraA/RecX